MDTSFPKKCGKCSTVYQDANEFRSKTKFNSIQKMFDLEPERYPDLEQRDCVTLLPNGSGKCGSTICIGVNE